MFERVKKNILISIAFAAIIYLALTIYGDYKSVLNSFSKFNWLYFPVLLLLTFSNFLTRFLKWHYYVRLLKIAVSFKDSFAIFMSGLLMSVTPGKMGELLKSFMLKKISGEPISKSAPIILAERITDFISLIFLALFGAYIFDYGKLIVVGTGIFFIAVLILISQKSISIRIIDSFKHIKYLSKHIDKIHNSYESTYRMLKTGPLIKMLLLSLVSWFFECFGFYLILFNFDIKFSVFWSTFVYAFSTIAGSITMLPAGLGVTEGSLTFLLVENGAAKNIAVASTFIIRVVTLWFAILIGIISITLYQKRFGKIIIENN